MFSVLFDFLRFSFQIVVVDVDDVVAVVAVKYDRLVV
jgi:hypothetical protein